MSRLTLGTMSERMATIVGKINQTASRMELIFQSVRAWNTTIPITTTVTCHRAITLTMS